MSEQRFTKQGYGDLTHAYRPARRTQYDRHPTGGVLR